MSKISKKKLKISKKIWKFESKKLKKWKFRSTRQTISNSARSTILGIIRPGAPFSWIWHLGSMVVILGICVILVILVPDIREIFGYVGTSSSSMLLFILPSMFYLKLMDGSWRKNGDKKFAMSFLVFGAIFSILTLGVIISSKL